MMSLIVKIRRFIYALRHLKPIYRYGGVATFKIETPSYNSILKGKCILVTGGSSGIGYAIAEKCLGVGAKVIITGRNEEKLKLAQQKLKNPNCYYLRWDIAEVDSVRQKLKECYDLSKQPIDILVNNAGVAPIKFFGDVDEEEWQRIYDTNLKGTYFLIQEIVKEWREFKWDGYRKILNISSQGGFVGATYPYRMTKWDIRGLTEGLGKELIKDNIIVNGIAPGIVKTSMQEFSMRQGDNLYTYQNPVQRVCLPEEIAELALFMISDVCNFIIGQTIVCDGGYSLK